MQQPIEKTPNFRRAGELYRSFTEAEKVNLIENQAGDPGKVTNPDVRRTMLSHFRQADADYGTRLAKALGVEPADVQKSAASRGRAAR